MHLRSTLRIWPVAIATGLMAASAPVAGLAGDVAAGRAKAITCQACHGLDGIAKLPDAPHLAGQPATYLERALRAYRDGGRKHEVMSLSARDLSDADIANLAAYYAAIRIEVTAVPK